jgi:hypothetical protein
MSSLNRKWRAELLSGPQAPRVIGVSSGLAEANECNGDLATIIFLGLESRRMRSREWRLLVFVLAFSCMVPQRGVAGPLPAKYWLFCTPVEPPPGSNASPFLNFFPQSVSNLFPQSVSFLQLQLQTPMFRLNEINLKRIKTPPEFRVDESKTRKLIIDAPCYFPSVI